MDLEKIDKKLYYVGHPDMINDTKILIEVIKEMNTEIERLKAINYSQCCETLPSKEEILLQARKVENYIGDEIPIVGAEKSGKFHGFLEVVEWLSNRQK